MKKLTQKQIINLKPCQDKLEFFKSCDFNAIKIWNTCERGDWLIWLLSRTDSWRDKADKVRVAIACAEHVLVVFEKLNPADKRPHQAIEAALVWMKNPTSENVDNCRDTAAYAANITADDAYSVVNDADTYSAAAYTVCADDMYSSYTVYIAAYTAASYVAYVGASTHKSESKWQADKIREMIPCPFVNINVNVNNTFTKLSQLWLTTLFVLIITCVIIAAICLFLC